MSAKASGTICKLITFQRTPRGVKVYRYTPHADAQSSTQLTQRALFIEAKDYWNSFSEEVKEYWNQLAPPQYSSGYHAFVAFLLKGGQLPYKSKYPPAFSSTYVKATSFAFNNPSFAAHRSTNPENSLIWLAENNQWLSGYEQAANQRFNIDLGAKFLITRLYYENSHSQGWANDTGVKDLTFQGSNSASAFGSTVYAEDKGWTIIKSNFQMEAHIVGNQPDPKYIVTLHSNQYRYYSFKFATNWGSPEFLGIRRIELQTVDLP